VEGAAKRRLPEARRSQQMRGFFFVGTQSPKRTIGRSAIIKKQRDSPGVHCNKQHVPAKVI